MKKHLFLFILTLAVLSVSNVWADTTLSFVYTKTGYNEGSETKYYCNGNKADKDKYIYDSDFNWNQTTDNVVVQDVSGVKWTGVDQSQACTRSDVSFSATNYTLTLLTYRTNHSATMTLPSISINGGDPIYASEARWGVSSTETIVSNQLTYENTKFQAEVRLVYNTTIASAGSYGVSISFPSGYDRAKDYVKTLTIAEQVPVCTAPSSVTITGTNKYLAGQTISLTATPSGGSGTATYQWQKEINSVWTDVEDGSGVSGATTNNLQITSCDHNNSGQYQCVVSTGASCSTNSDAYGVHVFSIHGAYYGGEYSDHEIVWSSGTTGTATIHLNASSTYMFKVWSNDGYYYGNGDGNYIIQPVNWNCGTGNSEMRLMTGPEGDYTFTVDIENAFSYVNVQVAYPDVTHPSTGYIYLSKWWDCYVHYWYNNDNVLSVWGYDPQISTYTNICGTDYWYFPVVGYYCNFIAKDNAGDPSNTTGDQYLGEGGSNGGKLMTHNGTSWVWQTFTTYTISFAAGDGSGSMSSITGICPSDNQAITANSFTAPTGYEFSHWTANVDVTINSATVTAGSAISDGATLQSIGSNITLTAHWSPITYTITLDKGDHGAANQSATVAYDATALTGITHVTATGYDRTGYYDGSTKVLNADGTFAGSAVTGYITSSKWSKADNCTLTAKWTPKTTTITIDDNDENHGSTSSSVTATWGSVLPPFEATEGEDGYGLIGYYTGANDGTKVINADGTLVQNVTGYTSNDATPVWIYETSTLDLYPHYEEMTTYSVTVNRNNSSYGTVTGAGSYASGATVNITATPAGGYEFVNWTTSDGVSFVNANSASTSFAMIGSAVTVQANFRAETCYGGETLECENYIEYTKEGSGTTNKPSGSTDSYPSNLGSNNYTGYGTPSGGYFAEFKGSEKSEMWMSVTLPAGIFSFTVVGGHASTMYFNLYNASTGAKLQSYELLKDSWQDNFITRTTSSYELSAGKYVIGLYGDNGWSSFDKVTVNNTSTYTVTYNATGAATGSTISAVDESSSAVSSGSSVSACTEVTFTATPASGCVVEHWQVNGVTYPAADGLTDFTLAINRNVTVTYTTTAASTYSVSVNRNNDSYGTVTGADTYTAGETVTITATPESGYGFVNWTTNDGVTFADATAAETTFTMPSKNVAVQANFAPLRTVSYEVVGDNGTVACAAVSSGGNVVSGRTLTFTATPDAGYSVLGWYTYDGASETLQANTRAQNSFNYTISSNITIRVKFTKIRIATGDANVGSHDGYADNNASMSVSNVVDPASKFDHKVLQITYTMNSDDNESSYYGMSLPVDAGYSTSIASGKTGMGFWYRTASTTDQVLMYFCISSTSDQFEVLLPATNRVWQYWYIETDKVDDSTTFGFYINGTKNGKSSGVIGSEATVWLSEVEPLTPADVTVLGNETKEIAPVVEDLVIYQGGEVTNSEDVIVTGSIAYHRHAKGGALTNKLDQWYTFAVPFTLSEIEVYDESDTRWYDVNAVHYTTNGDQSSEPDGPGHFYLQYLEDDDKNQMTNDRWRYVNRGHSLAIDPDDWGGGTRYGYPKKNYPYIILFDDDKPEELPENYWASNPDIRFVGGAQTIDGTAKEWKVESDDGEEYYMYANNTLHSFTLTGSAYVLNSDGTMFVLQDEPTIRPFECYIQATEEFKAVYSAMPLRRPLTPTAIEDLDADSSRTIKVLRHGHLIIIRNGHSYDSMGARVR